MAVSVFLAVSVLTVVGCGPGLVRSVLIVLGLGLALVGLLVSRVFLAVSVLTVVGVVRVSVRSVWLRLVSVLSCVGSRVAWSGLLVVSVFFGCFGFDVVRVLEV